MLWLIWAVVLSSVLMLYLYQVYSRFTNTGVKHLRPLPIFGNTAKEFFRQESTPENFDRLCKAFPKERFFGSYDFTRPVIILNDPELIKKVLVKDYEHFLDHRAFLDQEADSLLACSLFFLKGQKWKDMRATLSPAFTSSKIRLMIPFIEHAANQMIMSIKKDISDSGVDNIDVECKDLLARCTNDVIAACAFGLDVNSHKEKDNQFYTMAKAVTRFTIFQMIKFFAMTAFPTLCKKIKLQFFSAEVQYFYRKLFNSVINERINQNIMRPDMIHLLMEAKNGKLNLNNILDDDGAGFATVEESEVGKKIVTRDWSDDELIAQALLFLFAGFDTVSVAMTFLLFELAANPDVQEKLFQEIQETFQGNNNKFDFNVIQKMVYFDMVVSETLRKWPPVIISDRICTKTYNLGKPNDCAAKDYIIHKNEEIIVPTWTIQRSADNYPNPEKFDPERFSNENKHKIHPQAYMPFGAGPRNCIGSRFALCEIKVILSKFLLNFHVLPCEKSCLPIRIAKSSKFGLLIEGGHWLRIKTRNTKI